MFLINYVDNNSLKCVGKIQILFFNLWPGYCKAFQFMLSTFIIWNIVISAKVYFLVNQGTSLQLEEEIFLIFKIIVTIYMIVLAV